MEFTGERVVPGRTDPDLFNEHLARYRFAESLASGRVAVDAGCGTGYGAQALANRAAAVYALDNSFQAASSGRRDFHHPRLRYLQGDCAALPLRDGSVDVVVAFEVIEHLENWQGLLLEARRVLRPDGQLLVSTPNRPYYEESRDEPNPYHVHEFDYAEFRQALEAVFPHTTIFLENHTQAITFTPNVVQGLRTAMGQSKPRPEESHFFLAVCSKSPQFGSPAFIYVPDAGNVLRERERHIRLLEGELTQKTEWLAETSQALQTLTRVNQEEQRRAQESIERLEAEMAEKNAWAQRVDREIDKVRGDFTKLQQEFEERTRWAQQLEADYRQSLDSYERLEKQAADFKAEVLQKLDKGNAVIAELEQRAAERTAWAQSLDSEIEALRSRIAELRDRLAEVYGSYAFRIGWRLRLAPPPRPD